jgi:hypothetical protein
MKIIVKNEEVEVKKGDKLRLKDGSIVTLFVENEKLFKHHVVIEDSEGTFRPVLMSDIEEVIKAVGIIARVIKAIFNFFKK